MKEPFKDFYIRTSLYNWNISYRQIRLRNLNIIYLKIIKNGNTRFYHTTLTQDTYKDVVQRIVQQD